LGKGWGWAFAQTQQTYYDADKKIKKEIFHTKKVSGKTVKDGLYQIYYEKNPTSLILNPTSLLWQEGNYKDDKLSGEWKTYFNNGQLKQTVNYVNNLRQGNSKIYYDDGTLYQELIYKDDKMDGKNIFHLNTEK